jgi:hypothetical protein
MALMSCRRNGSLPPLNALSMTAAARPNGAPSEHRQDDDLEEALRIGRDAAAATRPKRRS